MRRFSFFFVLLACLFLGARSEAPALAVDQIKTTETFIGDSNTQISSQVNKTFSIYIGDNIAGITNPVKSVYFVITGVYTGSGTVGLQLNSDTGTLKTFTMVNTGSTPLPFEILYKDSTNTINPTSSGSYTYTLNIIPSGVTISGFGAKLLTTYRYAPPSCGGFPPTGELTSPVFDTTGSTNGAAYNSFLWKGSFNSGTGRVRFQLATSSCPNGKTNPPTCNDTGNWSFKGGATCASGDWYDPGAPDTPVEISCSSAHHNNQRYFKYKIQLCSDTDCTTAGAISPEVDDVVVNWSP
jgi:hypothetical protein